MSGQTEFFALLWASVAVLFMSEDSERDCKSWHKGELRCCTVPL